MSALGLSCNVEDGRLRVRGVVVVDGVAEEVFHYRAAKGEALSLQLRSVSDALATRLADLGASHVVVRSADHHSAARITDGAALRLRGEGVLLATARAHVGVVECLSGKAIGEACGTTKGDVDRTASAMLTEAATEATAAALAAERQVLDADRNDLVQPGLRADIQEHGGNDINVS